MVYYIEYNSQKPTTEKNNTNYYFGKQSPGIKQIKSFRNKKLITIAVDFEKTRLIYYFVREI